MHLPRLTPSRCHGTGTQGTRGRGAAWAGMPHLLETAAELRYCLPQGQAPNIRSLGGPGEEEQAAPYSMGAGRLRYRNPTATCTCVMFRKVADWIPRHRFQGT